MHYCGENVEILSVANLTRKDAEDFMRRASKQRLQSNLHKYILKKMHLKL